MTQQIINVGSAINDGTGDPARVAFTHCNENFTELYTLVRPTGQTIEYQFNNTTTEPPASGQIRFNQATQALTTKMWASHTTSSGINIKQFLAAATTGAKLVLQDKNDNTNYIKFDVTGAPVDKTTYWEFAVAVTASGGNLPNAAILAAVTAAADSSGTTIPGKLIGVQVFTASGTYTRSAGCTVAVVEVIGGGGGGGGADATAAGQISFAAGGGGGGYSCKRVSPGATETVTVGGGGAGGVPAVSGPVAGGTSSFGAHCSATGGQEGLSTAAASVTSPGGARVGGIGSGGDINIAGGTSGIPGAAFSGGFGIGSSGGDAARGGGGGAGVNFTGNGNAGRAYGGGGGGAANWASATPNKNGGAGAAGVVIVWEFGA